MKNRFFTKLVKERFFVLSTLLVVFLFFINRYIYVNRFDGYLYTDALNYNEFYRVDENYRIQGFERLPQDSCKLKILPLPAKCDWVIKDSKGNNYTSKSNELPVIKLMTGVNNYTISAIGNNELRAVKLKIEYHPEENYPYVVSSNLPLIDYQLYPIDRWTKLSKSISSDEINEVKKILREDIMVSDTNTTVEKIEKIGTYLIKKLRAVEGSPSGDIKQQTPLTQFKIACSKTNQIDCANYCDIFHLFANVAGVPTRKIAVGGWVSDAMISGHVFNESYVKEQKRWAFVDLTSKKLMVINNTKKKVLNTIDLLNIKNSKVYGAESAIVINSEDKKDTVDYQKVNQSENEYFKRAAIFYIIKGDINNNMDFSETFAEYLGTSSHYGTYYNGTFKIDNGKHYLKLYIFKTGILVCCVWFLVLLSKIVILIGKSFQKKSIKQWKPQNS